MIENKEKIFSIEGVRQMAKEAISLSGDLIEVDLDAIEDILLPKIEEYRNNVKESSWLPEGHDLPIMEEVGLNLFLNVINYCYKDPDTGCEYSYTRDDGKNVKRATGLITAMARSEVDWGDVIRVADIGEDEWKEMLQLSESNKMFQGLKRREKITGFAKHLLVDRGCLSVNDFLHDCRVSASFMTANLNDSGFFDDIFMKRSQLACRMINDVLVRRTNESLSGIEKLTVMADYQIPQVFYNTGVVSIIDRGLSIRLQNEIPIKSGSREEIALRATAICVGQYLANKLDISEAEMDGVLWGISQEMVKKGEMLVPHMVVATDAY